MLLDVRKLYPSVGKFLLSNSSLKLVTQLFEILLIAVCKDIKHREKEEELHFSGEMRI